jgi:hypothetical protein
MPDPESPHVAGALRELLSLGLPALERIYVETELGPSPRGRFRGVTIARLDNRGARRPLTRAAQWLGFELLPYGIDFDAATWFFVTPAVRIGRFEARRGRSRWRPTSAIRLHYDPSRLPRRVRALLYDEVKPLTERLVLGLGGLDAEAGDGDHFFFALEAMR